MINISQQDYSVLKQSIQQRYLRLYLLDFNYQVVDEISGNLTSFNINIDANSDIRRTCNVTLAITNSSFDINAGGKIWLDKYIQPYVGTYDIMSGEIVWRNQGIYLINAPTWSYNAETDTLSFQGIDLTAKLTGVRNGQLEGMSHVISEGSNVRDVIIDTLAMAGFNKYIVSQCENIDGTIQDVPYDIEISAGGTVWDILTELRNILPQYQMYFDVDGIFHYELIPSGDNEPIIMDDDLLTSILISEQIDTDFESVKNYIEVWGYTHDVQNASTSTTASGGALSLTIGTLGALAEGTIITWSYGADINTNVTINVNGTGTKRLVNLNGDDIVTLDADAYYVASYQSNGTWLFLGHMQSQAVYADTNPDSPFDINGAVGKIRYVCSGGEYDNIMSDELALQRAQMEIYWRCRLNDKIVLTTLPIPWLDVNVLISHATKHGGDATWMIDNISTDYAINGSMTITAHKYYAYYPLY